jgi:hypothetical protein
VKVGGRTLNTLCVDMGHRVLRRVFGHKKDEVTGE